MNTELNEEKVRETLRKVKDPELQIDIITLGLVRKITLDDKEKTGVSGVEILMTLTTPFCPFADELIAEVEDALLALGFADARVELSFDPPWEPSQELRLKLGI